MPKPDQLQLFKMNADAAIRDYNIEPRIGNYFS